jgi:surfactin synthase thioesterase subunit
VELRAVRLPGRLGRHREAAFTDCDEAVRGLAASLGQELAAEQAAGRAARPVPYALFGHSMGALLSYRLTRLLQHQGSLPPALLACASWPVRGVPRETMPDPSDPDDRFIPALQGMGGVPAEVLDDPDTRALTLPAVRADFRLCRSYVFRPESPLSVPVAVFGGADDTVASPASLTEWQHHAADYLGLRLFPGGHFFLRDQVPALSVSIADCLAQVLEKAEAA